ncbi:ankyrin repeat-containing domain protein [Pavlovales sp. CCMP2436]|nr:ankyrin repeat-containing domain protein [Pavlovales sp. CCMP2436]
MVATMRKNSEAIELLLNAGADSNRELSGTSALLFATLAGNLECATILLDAGAHVDQADLEGTTPLLAATHLANIEFLKLLLNAGADVNRADLKGSFPLMVATIRKNIEVMELLLNAGADSNRDTLDGMTLLSAAICSGQIELVKLILDAGASLNGENQMGMTPLFAAVCNADSEILKLLLDANADVHAGTGTNNCTSIMLGCMYRALEPMDATDASRSSRRLECMHYLIDADVWLDDETVLGCVRLMYRELPWSPLKLRAVQLLCAHGVPRETFTIAPDTPPDTSGCSAWLLETAGWVTQLHHLQFLTEARVRKLLRSGADVHAGAPTPFQLARALLASDAAHEGAALVVQAAAPWSRVNHWLFPEHARTRARALLRVGSLVARRKFESEGVALLDVWPLVVAHAISCSALGA